ncbi:MAG: hypothetical protein RLZZ157_1958 [Pseudomonadota bacterium]
MNILVLGQSGQLARALDAAAALAGDMRLMCVGRKTCDVRKSDALAAEITRCAPDVLINAAAFTHVDGAETDQDGARALNHDAAKYAAEITAQRKIGLIHISTDYVFDGQKPGPYLETDPTAPLNVYGQTKRDGEQAVLAAHDGALVVRTTWIHSPFGKNFVKTMLACAKGTADVRVVDDQIGAPTSAQDLAQALLALARAKHGGHQGHGIYHLTAAGQTSWHGFAQAIFSATAHWRTSDAPPLHAIPTNAFPTPAQRPLNSVLCCDKIARDFGLALPDWQSGLARTLDGLAQEFDERAI